MWNEITETKSEEWKCQAHRSEILELNAAMIQTEYSKIQLRLLSILLAWTIKTKHTLSVNFISV